jgi:hypothetical protein
MVDQEMRKAGIIGLIILLICCGKEKPEQSPLLTIYAPSAFRPEGGYNGVGCYDGCNRSYKIVVSDTTKLKRLTLFILDKEKNTVFQAKDLSTGWNGCFNNDPAEAMPGGEYSLVVNYVDVKDGEYQLRKKIWLLR